MIRNHFLTFMLLIAAVSFAGCGVLDSISSQDMLEHQKDVILTIYPETGFGPIFMGDTWSDPLMFSDDDDYLKKLKQNVIFENFDLDYEKGWEYKFKAKKVWMSNPPQDVSSIKYVVDELISKKKVITKDRKETMRVIVAPEAIPFAPFYSEEKRKFDSTTNIYDALMVRKLRSDSFFFVTEIEGFNFEPGFEYLLRIEKITYAEPYSVKYRLDEIISKTKI